MAGPPFKSSGQMTFIEFRNFWVYTAGGNNFGLNLNAWRGAEWADQSNTRYNWPMSNMSLYQFYGTSTYTPPSGGGGK